MSPQTRQAQIKKSQLILAELNRERLALEKMGVPAKDVVFDIIADRIQKEINTWEIAAHSDWENLARAKSIRHHWN